MKLRALFAVSFLTWSSPLFAINNSAPVLRVARPTNDFGKILKFYEKGLGLEVISRFQDHDGFDGIMLGKKESPYHFEFTIKKGHPAPKAPSEDHLIVFYVPEKTQYEQALNRMETEGFHPVKSFNPYWDKNGKTFQDFEGYRVVLSNESWK